MELVNAKNKKYYKAAMIILLMIEASFLFIQAAKSFQTKSVNDLNLAAFIILLVTNVAWGLYSVFILHTDVPLLLSAVLYVVGSALVIVAIVLYRENDEKSEKIDK